MVERTIEITIGCGTESVRLTCENRSLSIPDYYIGWTDATAEFFAGLAASQIEAMAERKKQEVYKGCFGNNRIFFLLYQPETAPQVFLTSSGITMQQSLIDDNTCPHDDVTLGGKTFKVFGIRFFNPNPEDSITIKI